MFGLREVTLRFSLHVRRKWTVVCIWIVLGRKLCCSVRLPQKQFSRLRVNNASSTSVTLLLDCARGVYNGGKFTHLALETTVEITSNDNVVALIAMIEVLASNAHDT